LLGAGVEREGLLMKRGSVIQSNWKKRYFVLAGEGLLCWHASEATARALSDALRGAAMEEATGRRMRSDSNAGRPIAGWDGGAKLARLQAQLVKQLAGFGAGVESHALDAASAEVAPVRSGPDSQGQAGKGKSVVLPADAARFTVRDAEGDGSHHCFEVVRPDGGREATLMVLSVETMEAKEAWVRSLRRNARDARAFTVGANSNPMRAKAGSTARPPPKGASWGGGGGGAGAGDKGAAHSRAATAGAGAPLDFMAELRNKTSSMPHPPGEGGGGGGGGEAKGSGAKGSGGGGGGGAGEAALPRGQRAHTHHGHDERPENPMMAQLRLSAQKRAAEGTRGQRAHTHGNHHGEGGGAAGGGGGEPKAENPMMAQLRLSAQKRAEKQAAAAAAAEAAEAAVPAAGD
jgi:hypothetical protein